MTLCFSAVLLCLLSAAPSLAQNQLHPPRGSDLTGADRISDAAKPTFGLVGLLQRTMAGKPVVGVSYHGDAALLATPTFREGDGTLKRLQVIAGKAEYGPLIPYVVGKTWVLAPETREALNPALPHMGLADAAPRGLAFDALLASLTPAQVPALGTDQGLAATSLPEGSRNALEAALCPPLRVVGPANPEAAAKRALGIPSSTLLDITEPLDLSRLRLRAHLANKGIVIPKDENTAVIIGGRLNRNVWTGPRLYESEGTPYRYSDANNLPITVQAPNTFKPSDLRTDAHKKPIGVSGIVSVADLVERLRTVTGLDLYESVPYGDLRVFLGSEAIPCSDVLDGLRLALTATWRKVGSAYILAWDREGLRAIQQRTFEQTRALRAQMKSFRDKSQFIRAWLALANDLPFDPDDPLSPTPEQRAGLIPAPDGKWTYSNGIPFEELTPKQKDAVRESLRMTGQAKSEDLPKGRLEIHADVMLEIQIPGVGWVSVPHNWQYGSIAGGNLAAEAMKARARTGGTASLPAYVSDQKPIALPAPMRGVLVPALPPSGMADLAREMKRHGLNTLFYPLLSNGYATYPSKVFPLNPALREKDGWAAAVSAMKAEGIRVIGTVDTLAWQNEGQSAHWLSRHRDWLDVDALGRPRLDWLKQFPDRVTAAYRTGFVPSNYVRAEEPAVAERLQRLVAEAALRPGIGGIAFATWRPVEPRPYTDALQPPALGFSIPDRFQAIRRNSLDPVDQPAANDGGKEPFLPRPLGQRRVQDRWSAPTTDVDRRDASFRLAEDLLRRAKAARSDWTVALIDDFASADYISHWDGPMIPKADLLISTRPKDDAANGALLPVWPPGPGDLWEHDAPSPFEPGLFYAGQWSQAPPLKDAKAIVYDFRAAPDEITNTLRWIAAPSAIKDG